MKKPLIFLFIIFAIFSSVAQDRNEDCSSISHKVNSVASCNLSTNTSVDVIWKINCPDNDKIKNGLTITAQFLNKYGNWNFPKNGSIKSSSGTIEINFSGLKFNTTQKIRYFAHPLGTNPKVSDITKEKLWKEYQFDIPPCK